MNTLKHCQYFPSCLFDFIDCISDILKLHRRNTAVRKNNIMERNNQEMPDTPHADFDQRLDETENPKILWSNSQSSFRNTFKLLRYKQFTHGVLRNTQIVNKNNVQTKAFLIIYERSRLNALPAHACSHFSSNNGIILK